MGKNNYLKLDMVLCRCPLKCHLHPRKPPDHSLKRDQVFENIKRYWVSALIKHYNSVKLHKSKNIDPCPIIFFQRVKKAFLRISKWKFKELKCNIQLNQLKSENLFLLFRTFSILILIYGETTCPDGLGSFYVGFDA